MSCQKNKLTVSKTTNRIDMSTARHKTQTTNGQNTDDHHQQFLEGPTLPRSRNTIKVMQTTPLITTYIRPQLIFQLKEMPNEQTVEAHRRTPKRTRSLRYMYTLKVDV